MLPYPKLVRFVKQVFSLHLRQTRLANLKLLVCGKARRAAMIPKVESGQVGQPTYRKASIAFSRSLRACSNCSGVGAPWCQW